MTTSGSSPHVIWRRGSTAHCLSKAVALIRKVCAGLDEAVEQMVRGVHPLLWPRAHAKSSKLVVLDLGVSRVTEDYVLQSYETYLLAAIMRAECDTFTHLYSKGALYHKEGSPLYPPCDEHALTGNLLQPRLQRLVMTPCIVKPYSQELYEHRMQRRDRSRVHL